MTKIICDMCKQEIPTNFIPTIKIDHKIVSGNIEEKFDICEGCCTKILEFIEGKKND